MSLTLWTIYDHPSDYPESFVARAFELDKPTSQLIMVPDLEELRGIMESFGLTRMPRDPGDDPCIVETWI